MTEKAEQKDPFPWGAVVLTVVGLAAAAGAIVLHALHPAGIYSIVVHKATADTYSASVAPATSNTANGPVEALALMLLVLGLACAFFSLLALGGYGGGGIEGFAYGLFFGAIVLVGGAGVYHNIGHNEHEDRTVQMQTQVDRWIAKQLHVPNNYDFLDNKPYVEQRPKGGDEVVVERTEGDFIKSYSATTTDGNPIKFTIARVKDTYTVRLAQPQVR